MKLNRSIRILAATAVLTLASGMDAHPAATTPDVARPAELADLLKTYRAWGLPLPPPHAPLVLFNYGWMQDDSGKRAPMYHLAFLLKAASETEPPRMLVGTVEYQPEKGEVKVRPVDAGKLDVQSIRAEWMKPVFGLNVELATALQCKAAGYDRLAARLLAASLRQDCGHFYSAFYQPANLPPKTALAMMAWAHWADELILPTSDRKLIARRMQELLKAEPSLDTRANQALLTDLEAALVPGEAQPGSIDSFIDDLVDLAYEPRRQDEPESRYQKLVLLGFQAVPSLIEHLDDRRLTRTVRLGFNNFPPYHLRVGDVVSDLLQGLAGNDLGKDWLRRQQGYTLDKAPVRAWWEKAQEIGEEEYLVKHVLPDAPNSGFPSQPMLDILVSRYPLRLPGVYRTLLDEKPALHSWMVARALSQSSVPTEAKLASFLYGATNRNLEHRRSALSELRKLNGERFVDILVATLNAVPSTPKEPYWTCPEANLAHVAMETDDPRAWDALLSAARRGDVGLRMEMMNPMCYTYIGQRQRQQRLAFVAAFLEDASVRDAKSNPVMFTGPYAGFTFPRLEVRNFAAMRIACILGLPEEPKPDWTSDQWRALRENAQASLKREQQKK